MIKDGDLTSMQRYTRSIACDGSLQGLVVKCTGIPGAGCSVPGFAGVATDPIRPDCQFVGMFSNRHGGDNADRSTGANQLVGRSVGAVASLARVQ
jgi:hypothetical protein